MPRKRVSKNKKVALPVLNPDAAGIDIGATEIYVAVPANMEPFAAIQKAGFFHFGRNHSDPKDSLQAALEQREKSHGDLKDSLIVVPEAFNIPRDYTNPASEVKATKPDHEVLNFLTQESEERRLTFVVGLVQKPRLCRRGYSCAYLINNGTHSILSHKRLPDGSPHYQPHHAPDKPMPDHGGSFVAALICLDASTNIPRMAGDPRVLMKQQTDRHNTLIKSIADRQRGTPALLCIPALMTSVSSESVAQYWCSKTALNNSAFAVIVANGDARQPSVIQFSGEPAGIRVCPEKTVENEIYLFSWPDFRSEL